jgi:hypothetical protein
VDVVPAYVAVADVIPDQAALTKWGADARKGRIGVTTASVYRHLIESSIAFSETYFVLHGSATSPP